MGLLWTRMSTTSRQTREIRRLTPSIETMENRQLLSHGLAAHPTIAERRALVAERVQQARQRIHAYNAEHTDNPQTISNGIDFTTNTVDTGKKLATSGEVLHVGADFARRSIAKDTAKVGWQYARAVIRADGKTLRGLGKTPLVKKVGQEFTALGHSDAVKKVGVGFSNLGQAVSRAYHKLF